MRVAWGRFALTLEEYGRTMKQLGYEDSKDSSPDDA